MNSLATTDKGTTDLPEVTWHNTCLPLSEHLDNLTVTKPWQLSLKEGNEVLTMIVPPGVEVRDHHPSKQVTDAEGIMPSQVKQDRAWTLERRVVSEVAHQTAKIEPDEVVDEEDDFRSAENDHGTVAADNRDGDEVDEVTKAPPCPAKAANAEPDEPLKSALAGANSVPSSGGGFSIRAAPLMVSAGMELPPGEQVAEEQVLLAEVAAADDDDAPAAEAAAAAAAGNTGRAQREQRRPARLTDIDEGPQLASKPRKAFRKESGSADRTATAEKSGDVAKANAKASSGVAGTAARVGAPSGAPAVDSAKEKMRPHKKLANIYARAPEALHLHACQESSACSAEEEMGEPDAIAEAAAAGLLAVAAGRIAPSRKRKAAHATRVSKGDGAEAMTARSKSVARDEQPYKVGNYTKSSTLEMARLKAVRADALARQELEACGDRRKILAGFGREPWWGGNTHEGPLGMYGGHPQGAFGRESYNFPPFGASGQGGQAVFAGNHSQQMQAFGPTSQLSQSSVGAIVSRFYNYKPPAPTGRIDPRHPTFEPNALQSFRNPSRGWDSSALHHVAAPMKQNWERGGGSSGGSGSGSGAANAVGSGGSGVLEGLDAGTGANEAAMRRWQNNLAQHMMAGHGSPRGNFMVDPAEQAMFRAPATREAYEETLKKNQFQLSKLCDTMDRLRRVLSSITEPVPSQMRMVIISRAQRLLEEISQSVSQIPPSEHAPLAAAVVEVQSWVQRQLRERMDEILITKPMQKLSQQAASKPRLEKVKAKGKDAAAGDNRRKVNDAMGPPSNSNAGTGGGAGAPAQKKGAEAEDSARPAPPVSAPADPAANTSGRFRENAAAGPPCNEDNEEDIEEDLEKDLEDDTDEDLEEEEMEDGLSPTVGRGDDAPPSPPAATEGDDELMTAGGGEGPTPTQGDDTVEVAETGVEAEHGAAAGEPR